MEEKVKMRRAFQSLIDSEMELNSDDVRNFKKQLHLLKKGIFNFAYKPGLWFEKLE